MSMIDIACSRHGKWLCALVFPLMTSLPAVAAGINAKVSDSAGIPVVDAVIYALPKAGTRIPMQTPRSTAIEQRDREFVPNVTVVQTGTTVSFPNHDPLLHHVYSFSPAKSFEIKLYSGEAPRGILFDKPGTVTLGCNIHDWMVGHILVVETPYFGKSGKDGRALIGDMAAGEFEVFVWHPAQRASADAKLIKLDARSKTELEFTLDTAPLKKPFKPPLDGVRYQ